MNFCKTRSNSQLLVTYLGGDAQHEWRSRRSCDWSREQSRNQLRLISKRCANNFFQRADEYLK